MATFSTPDDHGIPPIPADGYTVVIRDLSTGEDVWYNVLEAFSLYHWAEGNAACDCNRSIFYHNGADEEDVPCGNSLFYVPYAVLCSGEIIPIDKPIQLN